MPGPKGKNFHVLLIYSLNKHLCLYYVSGPVLGVKGTIVKKISKDQDSREHILAGDIKYKNGSMKKNKAEDRK